MEHQLTIYNTLDRKKELFVPLHAPHVGMYVCGPTVYGDAHLDMPVRPSRSTYFSVISPGWVIKCDTCVTLPT